MNSGKILPGEFLRVTFQIEGAAVEGSHRVAKVDYLRVAARSKGAAVGGFLRHFVAHEELSTANDTNVSQKPGTHAHAPGCERDGRPSVRGRKRKGKEANEWAWTLGTRRKAGDIFQASAPCLVVHVHACRDAVVAMTVDGFDISQVERLPCSDRHHMLMVKRSPPAHVRNASYVPRTSCTVDCPWRGAVPVSDEACMDECLPRGSGAGNYLSSST